MNIVLSKEAYIVGFISYMVSPLFYYMTVRT